MPLYEFACGQGHHFDKLAKVGERDASCPDCGSIAARLPVQSFSFRVGVAAPPDSLASDPKSPDFQYIVEDDKRQLKKRGWDADRAYDFLRKGVREDARGVKFHDPKRAVERGG